MFSTADVPVYLGNTLSDGTVLEELTLITKKLAVVWRVARWSLMAHLHRRVGFGPSTPQPSSEGALQPSSVTAHVSTTASTLTVGLGLSWMAMAAAAT